MDNNHQELEGIVKNNLPVQNLSIPRLYRYTNNTIWSAVSVVYFGGASHFLVENLEDSKVLQATLPLAIMGIVAGYFVIRERYSRVVYGLARLIYSNSAQSH